MIQTRISAPPLRPSSTPIPTYEKNGSTNTSESPRRVRRVPRITIEFSCLMCSRDFGMLVCSALPLYGDITIRQPGGFNIQLRVEQLRFLCCSSCGGSILPTEITREEVRVERRINWSDDRPRRGRPPKWLVEQRRNSGQSPDDV